jgi:hypothetical protein
MVDHLRAFGVVVQPIVERRVFGARIDQMWDDRGVVLARLLHEISSLLRAS